MKYIVHVATYELTAQCTLPSVHRKMAGGYPTSTIKPVSAMYH